MVVEKLKRWRKKGAGKNPRGQVEVTKARCNQETTKGETELLPPQNK